MANLREEEGRTIPLEQMLSAQLGGQTWYLGRMTSSTRMEQRGWPHRPHPRSRATRERSLLRTRSHSGRVESTV